MTLRKVSLVATLRKVSSADSSGNRNRNSQRLEYERAIAEEGSPATTISLGYPCLRPRMRSRRPYRKLSLELHPDKNKSPDASDLFTELKDAYDVLYDASQRRNYDRQQGLKSYEEVCKYGCRA